MLNVVLGIKIKCYLVDWCNNFEFKILKFEEDVFKKVKILNNKKIFEVYV